MSPNLHPRDISTWPLMNVRRERGFTLMELLVVLVIIGIIVSFAGLSVGQHSSRSLQDEAERIYNLLRLASDEAVLQGNELALQFGRQDYRFMFLNGADWQPIEDDKLLRARELPPNLEVALEVEGAKANFSDEENPPRILVLSSSEMTPFVLTLRLEDDEGYRIEGNLNGKLTLKKLSEGNGG